MFSCEEQKTSSSPSSEKFKNRWRIYKDLLKKRIDAEQKTSSTSSREKFNDDVEIQKDLVKRFHIVVQDLKTMKALENKLVSNFGDFDDQCTFLIKQGGTIEEKSAHEMLEQFLTTPPPSPRTPSVRSENYSNFSTQREKNNDNVDDKKHTDEKDLLKDPNKVNNRASLRPNANNIIRPMADPLTRQLLDSEPQPSTSAAARALNRLNYTIKRKMDNDDQKIMDAGTVSIGNNQKQKEHSENTKVNVKPFRGLTSISPSGTKRKILGPKPQPSNTTTQLKDVENLAIKNSQHLKEEEDVKKTVILKPNMQPDNDILDSEPQPSTSKAAMMSLKRKISNDANNIIRPMADPLTRQLLDSEPQPSTSAAARALNRLNYTIKRKMDNDDQKIMDAGTVSIGNNQKQKEHSENTKVNVKPFRGLTSISPSGTKRTILGPKPQPSNTTTQLKDVENLAIKNSQHLKEEEDVKKTVILKPNMQPDNDILDSEPQPSTSKAAMMSLKRKISNDVQDWQTDVRDLSIKSNQTTPKTIKNTIILKPNGTNISVAARIDTTLAEAARSISQLFLTSEPQPSTSTRAITLKYDTSNDVVDDQKFTVAEDLSIKNNQQLKEDPKITDNTVIVKPIDTDVNAQTCSAKLQSLSSAPQPSTSTGPKSSKHTKRKTTNKSLDGKDIFIENKQQHEYPKKTDESVILGPNGTKVPLQDYDAIIWTTAPGATRQLLGFVFSNDELATHTLTGKPSPAFYGRERPEKMQLNPEKISDVIHCVRTLMKCSEREVRGAITTKCSDTSKKYKRRSLKQSKATTPP